MATIYEVAKLAGVSPATVSRVFNGMGVSDARASAHEGIDCWFTALFRIRRLVPDGRR